jgi:hypothetical protein
MKKFLSMLLVALAVTPVMAKTNNNDGKYTEKYSFEEKSKEDKLDNIKLDFVKIEVNESHSDNFNHNTSPVPEPESWMMLLAGGILISRVRRKYK